jgi:hypothetical protein
MPYVFKERERPPSWRECRARVPHRIMLPFFYVDWLASWTAYLLGKWSLLEVLEYSGSISIVIGVILYFAGAKDRMEQKHYQAWQVINLAQGKGGSGGRLDALQELHADGVPLVGVDVSDAFLENLELSGADLRRADFAGADMKDAKLGATNLTEAIFTSCNLRSSDLHAANLDSARCNDADLNGANLSGANLHKTLLKQADLRQANLNGILDWKSIPSISWANILGVKNAPAGFVDWAKSLGAVEIADDDEWIARIPKE